MKDIIKYFVSAIMLILSVILYINYSTSESESQIDSPQVSNYLSNLKIDKSVVNQIFEKVDKQPSKVIYPAIFITTEACFLCMNNVVEFSELLKKDSTFATPILLFLNEDENEVNRFIGLSEIELNYKNITDPYITSAFESEKQNLLLIDIEKMKVVYNFPIPNAIMLPESKLQILELAKEDLR